LTKQDVGNQSRRVSQHHPLSVTLAQLVSDCPTPLLSPESAQEEVIDLTLDDDT